MRILWTKVGGLWPPDTGGRLRSLHILAELSRRHRVTLMTTHAPGADIEGLRQRLQDCEEIVSVPYVAPKWNSPRFPFTLMRSWLSALPVDIWKSRVPALRRSIAERLAVGGVDLCVADFLFAAPNVPLGGPVPVVYFAHNVEYMIWKRLCEVEPSPLRRGLLEVEWRKMRHYEAEVCRRAQLCVAVSEQDRRLLSHDAPQAQIREISTGVDTAYFRPNGAAQDPMSLVFTGSMDWHPNEDAILYFMDEILPRIRRELPEVSLTVVGRNPRLRLIEAAKEAGVNVTGSVEDVRPYVDGAAVYVVPLRVGGGTRLKIFEALAMEKPVVSTAVGAEGLPLKDGRHYLQADRPEAFAAAVVGLLRDPERRRALGLAGRRLTEERFSWTEVAREFGACCETALN